MANDAAAHYSSSTVVKVVFPQVGREGIPVLDVQSHQFMALCLFGPVIYWQIIQGGTSTRPQPSASGRKTHSVKAACPYKSIY